MSAGKLFITISKSMKTIMRKKGSELTDQCPICGGKHVHGASAGTRISHCPSPYKREVYKIVEY